jgi:hypothetical protein
MTLPLTPAVNAYYNLPGIGTPRAGFNLGLIIGTSSVISTTTRVAEYASLAEMAAAGFSLSSPEYLAASRYFAATSKPTRLLVGRQGSGETPVAALTACRLANSEWYAAFIPGANDSESSAVAAYVESASPLTQYIFQSSTAAIKAGTAGNLFETLKASGYDRTQAIFSTDAYLGAAVLGYACGQVSGLANSAFTLKFKRLPGATAETLTSANVTSIQNNNGNVYVERMKGRPWYENGTNCSGAYFDEILYYDKLATDIQNAIADQLYQVDKLPQTDDGMAQLASVVSVPCEEGVNIGYLAPGQWNGEPVLELKTGDFLPKGYMVQFDSIDQQSQTDRDARKAPNIYVSVKGAGAIHSVTIAINVNR